MKSEYLRSILESLDAAVVACDERGLLNFMNKKARELLGTSVTKAGIQEWTSHFRLYKSDGKTRLKIEEFPLYRALHGEHIKDEIYSAFTPEDRRLYSQVSARPLLDENGKEAGAICTFYDITEAQAAARLLSSRFEAVLEQSPFSIQICDKHGKNVLINPAYRKLWGVTDELLDYVYNVYNILEDKAVEAGGHMVFIKKAYAGETVTVPPFYYDPGAHGLPGQARWAGGSIFPLKDEKGEVQEIVIIHYDVTEQHAANAERESLLKELNKHRSRTEAIFAQSPLSIQLLDKHGKTLLVNDAFKKLWAISDDFLADYIYKDYNILEDKLLEANGQLAFIKRGYAGEIVHAPAIYYDPSSLGLPARPRWAEGLVYPLKDESGEVKEVVIIHQDITDQYEASQERDRLLETLKSERNLISAVVSQLPAGLLVAENSGQVLIKNQQLVNLLGPDVTSRNSLEESMDLKFYKADGSIYAPGEWPLVRTLRTGESIKGEEMHIFRDHGRPSVFNVDAGPVLDEDGRVTAGVIVTTDITEKKREQSAERFLASIKSILMSTLDHSQVIEKIAAACVPNHADGCLIDLIEGERVVRIVTKHVDPEKEEFIKMLDEKYPAKNDDPRPSLLVMKTAEPILINYPDEIEFSKYSVDEEHLRLISQIRWRSSISVPLKIRGKMIGSLTFVNTTDRPHFDMVDVKTSTEIARRAATALENARLYRDLQKSIRLRDEFISVASHELKTPLTTLNLQLEVLGEIMKNFREDGENHVQTALLSTRRQMDRLTRLVDDMLDISSIETGRLSLQMAITDMGLLAMEVVGRFKAQLNDLKIDTSIAAPEGALVFCDPFRLEQVITNLMSNAIKYGNRRPVHLELEKSGGKAFLKVRDHGRGIAKEDQERIFQRFERAVGFDDIIGLGLGLYISSQLMEEMKGRILVESRPGEGSTFTLELPLV